MENKCQLRDFVKCRIGGETINCPIKRSGLSKKIENDLLQTPTTQEELLASDIENVTLDDSHKAKHEWKSIQQTKLKGSILRSKMKWVEKGEKNHKYFLNLEKQNYNVKHMKKLILGQNTITNPIDIIKEQKNILQ